MSEKNELKQDLNENQKDSIILEELLKQVSELEKQIWYDGIIWSGDSTIDKKHESEFKKAENIQVKIMAVQDMLEEYQEELKNIEDVKNNKLNNDKEEQKKQIQSFLENPKTEWKQVIKLLKETKDNDLIESIFIFINSRKDFLLDKTFCTEIARIDISNVYYIENPELIIEILNNKSSILWKTIKDFNALNFKAFQYSNNLNTITKVIEKAKSEELINIYNNSNFWRRLKKIKEEWTNNELVDKVLSKIDKTSKEWKIIYTELNERKLSENELSTKIKEYWNINNLISKKDYKNIANILNIVLNNNSENNRNIYNTIISPLKEALKNWKLEINNETRNIINFLKNPDDNKIASEIQNFLIKEIVKWNISINAKLLNTSVKKWFLIDSTIISKWIKLIDSLLLNIWDDDTKNGSILDDFEEFNEMISAIAQSTSDQKQLKSLNEISIKISNFEKEINSMPIFNQKIRSFIEKNKELFKENISEQEISKISKSTKIADFMKNFASILKNPPEVNDLGKYLEIYKEVINFHVEKNMKNISDVLELYNNDKIQELIKNKILSKSNDEKKAIWINYEFTKKSIDEIKQKVQNKRKENTKLEYNKVLQEEIDLFIKENKLSDPTWELKECLINDDWLKEEEIKANNIKKNPELGQIYIDYANWAISEEEFKKFDSKLSERIQRWEISYDFEENKKEIDKNQNSPQENNPSLSKTENWEKIFSQKVWDKNIIIKESELTENEKKDISKEKIKQIIEFRAFLEDLWLDFLWQHREKLAIDLRNSGSKFDYLDANGIWNSKDPQEQLDLLNFIWWYLEIEKSNNLAKLKEDFKEKSKFSEIEIKWKTYKEKWNKSIFENILEWKLIDKWDYMLTKKWLEI